MKKTKLNKVQYLILASLAERIQSETKKLIWFHREEEEHPTSGEMGIVNQIAQKSLKPTSEESALL